MSMSLANQAGNVAAAGRYGDTTLLHLNNVELQGIASILPLTVNPQTGYAEAFLPLLLAPALAASMGTAGAAGAAGLGAGALTGAGAMGLGTAAALPAAGALGAGTAGATGAGLASTLGATGGIGSLTSAVPLSEGMMLGMSSGTLGGSAAPAAASAGGAASAPSMAPLATNPTMSAGPGGMPSTGQASVATRGGPPVGPSVPMQPGAPSPVAPAGQMPGGVAGPEKGIGSFIDNNKMAIASALAPAALSMLGSSGGGAPKKKKYKKGRRMDASRERFNPGVSNTGVERDWFGDTKYTEKPYARGGLVRGYAQGGMVDGMGGIGSLGGAPGMQGMQGMQGMPGPQGQDQMILSEAVQAIQGAHPDPKSAIKQFIQRFGPEAFEALMKKVISAPPQAAGPGASSPFSDGRSDSIPAINPDGGPAALSEGEYVMPANAVSSLGNGSTEAGGRVLDGLSASAGNPQAQIDPRLG